MDDKQKDRWNASLYDDRLHFVSRLGREVVDLLQPCQGERILDLGCGTGDLSFEISQAGASVHGIDSSPAMIQKARQKFPGLSFEVADALTYRKEQAYDAVFSNAVLHWIQEPGQVIENIWESLRPGGRFVAEFGGKGNVGKIIHAIAEALHETGIRADKRNPWYYPSLAEYSLLLEQQGFTVRFAAYFDRPTPLPGGEEGLHHWLDMFAGSFFAGLPPVVREKIYEKIKFILRNQLFNGKEWIADYRRLRVLAVKSIDLI
ncbi:class I SAM-dependent methyltransferase [Lihuaxuella thermophila]|uniref:Methyltransferase domain-containing protein n=1 Tax=Lihuaxuella thermophila TaxID=1173111 RepID=A0A1H8JG87_9BACL|nr:methyltransferase [Lihuaxuella thermophila]SEN79316.1 Methyltransferase domain-containing protein [Lihuaxuella thermophila]